MPKRYSRAQIVLHWATAALVLVQLVYNEAVRIGFGQMLASPSDQPGAALVHVGTGVAILALTGTRLVLRFRRGVPEPPAGLPPLVKAIAAGTHATLYSLLILIPVTGLGAWYLRSEGLAVLHEVGRMLLVPVIAGHGGGALVEHLVMRNDTLRRMFRSSGA